MNPGKDAHWLVDVAAAAGVRNLGLSSQPGFTEIRSAWERISSTVGLPEAAFAARVASHFRLPMADVDRVERRALALLPREVAAAVGVLPLRLEGETLVLATADPMAPAGRERIAGVTGRMLRFEVTGPRMLEEALERHYSESRYAEATLRELLAEASVEEGMVVRSAGMITAAGLSADAPAVVELVRRILHYAAGRGATDIHVEPRDGAGRVRLRVDGVMQSLLQFPSSALARIVQRLKSLAGLDPWDHQGPGQEGVFQEAVGGKTWEIRLRTGVVPEGQKLVLRLLDRSRPFALERLGYPGPELERLREILGHREGLVIFTGPQRSGITTLTYCALSHLATADRNVASLENPLEVTLPSVNQTPFDRDRWPGYHVALEEVLHQDADVIGAGELRDPNTARMALRAGVTGHLVVATLHTPDAVSAIGRLLDLGLDGGRIAESLRGVVAQRLVRRLCPSCSRPVEAKDDLPEREQALVRVFGAVPARAAAGCSACGNTGYQGQLACPEVLVMTEVLMGLVGGGSPLEALEGAAFSGGGRRMLHVALDRVEQGETTLAEVARVFGEEPSAAADDTAPATILVVDDDAADRLLVRTVLEGQGMVVKEATGGAEALAMVEADPDVAAMVLDLRMPEMSGLEVLRRVRGSFRTYALPVVVLTSSGDMEDEISLLEAGADDFVRKPVDPRRLMARLRAATRRSSGFAPPPHG
jgi:type II secretory ATPase GspE/PulE/Tfp pilus assembly ATPase PilB-like protein/CheY-like chemotaxis protein